MPVLNGARAWLETPNMLKMIEYMPSEQGNKAMSYVVASPGEPFSLRYDHIPIPDYDLAWKLSIQDESDGTNVEQWGGPPMEMRKTKGLVKVRAMRLSEDGTRLREFAWAQPDPSKPPSRGTITLSLHLCHFAEATVEVPKNDNNANKSNDNTNNSTVEGGQENVTGYNDLNKEDRSHSVLAPPTTRPQGSKLWTWYWRDEEPRAIYQFHYATREVLEAEGIVPTPAPVSMLADESKHDKHLKLNRPTHARHPSDLDDLFNGRHASPGEAMKHKHKMAVLLRLREQHHRQEQQRLQVLRARAASTSSTDSSVSLGSDDDHSIEDGAPAPEMPTEAQDDMQQSDSGLMQQEQEVVAA